MTAGRFHLLAILLVLGGSSVGYFAGRLLAGPPEAVRPRLDPEIESRVDHYRREYGLDERAADGVRRELTALRHALQQKRIELQARHQDEFEALVADARRRIDRHLEAARPEVEAAPAAGEAGPP